MKSSKLGWSILLFIAATLAGTAAAQKTVYDVRDFGAIGDGTTVNTGAVQAAIDSCSGKGGGVVLVAGGEYVTGTIFLNSYVTLRVEAGATLLGSTNIDDYADDTHKNMYKNEPHMDRCLIFARDAHHIAIEGNGIIDGQGHRKNFPNKDKEGIKYRPMMIRMLNCSTIRMRDITLQHPAAWTSAWLYCDDIVVDGITIWSRANGNGDGLDFDSCENVRVSNSNFDTSDDSICLQASDPDKPCRDVTISNCIFSSKWAGMRIGLLSRGDFENVTVTNCTFKDIQDSGLKIQMCEGGEMKNMVFTNLVMRNVPRPIFMTFGQQRAHDDSPPEVAPMDSMHGFIFNGIYVDNRGFDENSAFVFTGMPGRPIEDVLLTNVTFISSGGGSREQGDVRKLNEFTLEVLEGWWPEYYRFGGTVPAHGLFARHVKDLTIDRFKVVPSKPDARPVMVCDDVIGLDVSGLQATGNAAAESLIRLQDVQDAIFRGCTTMGDGNNVILVEGSSSGSVQAMNNIPELVIK